ncbi:MAG TPA: prolyl oligopeptidase family serine peptidase [Gemmataceae bacterium]|nr:prolyl oligopeptidase family serine peptidase [Gemmataceae bacterium]
MTTLRRGLPLLLVLAAFARADGPADNLPDNVRRIPPPGVAVPDEIRRELATGVEELGRAIAGINQRYGRNHPLRELLPDVQIYHKAVDWALRYDEFFDAREFAVARRLLQQGLERARQLGEGQSPWAAATGLVARGYVSKIDGSVQPYGLVVPATFQANAPHQFRLDLWWHGRGEKLSELSFINDRQTNRGQFTPANAFVLHPYGRYCNANKFAGEVDTFEAMEHVKKHYPIDEDRVVARGFSMGGASCWQFATHFPGVWCAAAPGAGFAETAEFLNNFQNEKVQPTEHERKLWHWYDATDYAGNLYFCPTVAYSGEIDRQKQAADVMAREAAKEGLTLRHIIGPKTAHAYHPQAKQEIDRRIDALAAAGRQKYTRLRFTTWTLRYPRLSWLSIDGLEKHWERARISVSLGAADKPNVVEVMTDNVSAFTLDVPPDLATTLWSARVDLEIDGQRREAAGRHSDRWWTVHFRKSRRSWSLVESPDDGVLRKRPGLQGPIDDAFCDRFVMVRPTGPATPNEKVGDWVKKEMAHAIEHWRRQFRGDAVVKDDTAVTAEEIANSNLILWGEPETNAVLKKIAGQLPIRWDAKGLTVNGETFDARHHVPVLIYPNPLNPKKYVVLNSGFTFREYDYLNNARQLPKLPDWAVLDLSQPPSSRFPGKVVAADFFDEEWKVRK